MIVISQPPVPLVVEADQEQHSNISVASRQSKQLRTRRNHFLVWRPNSELGLSIPISRIRGSPPMCVGYVKIFTEKRDSGQSAYN
jgi:hypothetical protein